VRILVAMMEPKNLDKMNELQGYACLGVSVTVKLREYDFFFRRERQDFVPDKGFTPFFWKRKGDDTGNDGTGHDNDDNDEPTRDMASTSASMDVDKPQGGHSTPHSKAVPIGPGVGNVSPYVLRLLLLILILKLCAKCKLSKRSGLGRLGSFLLLQVSRLCHRPSRLSRPCWVLLLCATPPR
jgi:hypothetical protein